MKYILILSLLCAVVTSCDRVKQTAKDSINTAGEAVGESTSQFVEGVKSGVDETFGIALEPGAALPAKGITLGKYTVGDSTGTDNLLTVYLKFDAAFNGTLRATVFDHAGSEYGRAKADVKAEKNDAQYVDFVFDKRTNIEMRSRVVIDAE